MSQLTLSMYTYYPSLHLPSPTAHKVSEMDKQRQEEAKILHSIQETRALMSVGELAKGVVYSESLKTGWRPPRYIREASQSKHERIRKKMHILTEGEDVPPPIKTFKVRGTPTCVRSLVPFFLLCCFSSTAHHLSSTH